MSTNFENLEEKRINCEGGFGIMPHRLRKAENININAKFLFLALIELQHEKGYCYASNKYLASQELNGVSVRSIQNWLNELEENGWIKTDIIRGEKNEVIQRRIYTNLNQNNPINTTVNNPHEKFFMTPHESTFMTPHESTFTYKKNNIEKEIKENTKRSLETEKNIPASGSPSSHKVDELRLAEEIFENRFWVLVQNKVGKEQAKKLFFRITKNCKSEEKVNEVIEGYKRYLSFLAKNKANNFNRRPKDPATFLNLKNKLWLEPWEFNEDEVVLNASGSRIKQPKNWQDRIGVAKSLGLLDDFEQEEIREMYKAWKFIPHEAKKAIASEAVDNRLKQIDEYRKTEKERQQKEEEERKKQKNARLARDYEDEYQSLKDVLNFDYENLEDALSHGEKALYEVVNKILEYEQQQEEKEAEIKRQQELEQKKIDAEKSKIALEEAEKDLWTYVDKTVDVNAYLEKNKKKFPNSYEKFKALFCNGETLTDVVFGDLAKDTVVDRLKNNILSFLINEMSNEEARNLYNKRNEAWTIWNKTQK